jgi:hypothetical protein
VLVGVEPLVGRQALLELHRESLGEQQEWLVQQQVLEQQERRRSL